MTDRHTIRGFTTGAVLFSAAFVVLSPISSLICSSVSAPHVPEVLAVPFLWFFRRELVVTLRAVVTRRLSVILVSSAIWTALLLFGLSDSPRLQGTLSSARSYLLILTAALCSREAPPLSARTLLIVSLGSTTGSIAQGFLDPNVINADVSVNLGNIAAAFHVAHLSVGAGTPLLLAVAIPLLGFRVIQSAYRQVAIAAVLGAGLAIIGRLARVRRLRDGARVAVGIVGLGAGAYGIGWYIVDVGVSPTQYNRLVTRFAERGDTGDMDRIGRIESLPEDLARHPLPEGFAAKGFDGSSDAAGAERHGMLMDLPVYELIVMFGGPLALIAYSWFLVLAVKAVVAAIRLPVASGDESLAMSSVLYIGLSWITGAFLWHSFEAIYFGIAIGRWVAITRPLRRLGPVRAIPRLSSEGR